MNISYNWLKKYLDFNLTPEETSAALTSIGLETGGIEESAIISPYYKKDDTMLERKDGVGLFHDRIIFAADNFDVSKMPQIKEMAIAAIADMFCMADCEYLKEYFA